MSVFLHHFNFCNDEFLFGLVLQIHHFNSNHIIFSRPRVMRHWDCPWCSVKDEKIFLSKHILKKVTWSDSHFAKSSWTIKCKKRNAAVYIQQWTNRPTLNSFVWLWYAPKSVGFTIRFVSVWKPYKRHSVRPLGPNTVYRQVL